MSGFRRPIKLPHWLLCAGFGCLAIGCTAEPIRNDLSTAEREEDLAYVASVFADREQSFTPHTRALFEARLARVRARLETMSHDEFIADIQWIVAAADNGHTEALSHEHQRMRLPVDLEWFADGLYVIAARPDYQDLLGAHVETMDGRSPESVLTALDAYSPGTDEHARVTSGYFLERPELLAAIGEAESADGLTIAFTLTDGARVTRRLPGQSGPSTARADDSSRVLDGIDPLPLYLRDSEQSAFSAWLPELDAIYVRINRNDDKTLPNGLEDILARVRERKPRNAVVDLRLNGGGNYQLSAPFAEALPALLPDDGRLVIILGRRSFSAAIVTAAILKARAGQRAIIVGENPGDDLQFWSEGGFLTLPNSGLRIHYSDGFHDWRQGYDPQDLRNRSNPRIATLNARYSAAAGSLAPMQSIPLTFHDFATGHDPVMAAIALLLT